MRIPLDYYRILGLPIQATAEQLQQAHRDRTLQLPRREYSEAAIAARRQLLDEAHVVLSDPEQRQAYDASFLAKSYDMEARIDPSLGNGVEPAPNATAAASPLREAGEAVPPGSDPYTPSIEIQDHQLVGALLILLELGEYEVVLKLGRPYLSSGKGSLQHGRFGEPDIVLSDIVLTLAFACLELGREQWQQGQYENAAESLETGRELLLREGSFPQVRGEMQADLYKLRPYRVLELLALPESNVADRRQGLALLREMLQDRGGIDGTNDDQSGLNIDDFLRFIQQLRSYLTAAEQQVLFEAEARRPSAVATYLAVYALLALGFADRQPALVRRAKLMLIRLGTRQDVHLEQAVCALLLGQTEEASRALELSQEYESLAFIREHSQGSPDLLPGLCLYSERWLQNEVFAHFRDLAERQAALKDYFADNQVQAYLEALPNEPESENQWVVQSSPSSRQPIETSAARSGVLNRVIVQESNHRRSAQQRELAHPPSATATIGKARSETIDTPTRAYSNGSTMPSAAGPLPAERVAQSGRNGGAEAPFLSGDSISSVSSQPESAIPPGNQPRSTTRIVEPDSSRRSDRSPHEGNQKSARIGRIALLLALGAISIAALAYIADRASLPALKGEQLDVEISQPPIAIPTATAAVTPTDPTAPLTKASAQTVIQTWLDTKAAALGQTHAIDRLPAILVDPALSHWQTQARDMQQAAQYFQYQHQLQVNSVETDAQNPDAAIVAAQVSEAATLYNGGQASTDQSRSETLQVRYQLVRQDGEWRIKDWTVTQ